MKSIGLVTIGQSPRLDLTPDLESLWQGRFQLVEQGALDDLSTADIANLAPKDDETVLISRLRDGSSARLGEERLIPLVQKKIRQLEHQVGAIYLLCTGEFPAMNCQVPLFEPDAVLRNTVRGIIKPGQTLGVIVPQVDQQDDIIRRWRRYIPNTVLTDYASPYDQDLSPLEAAAKRLMARHVDMIVLDCLGFSEAMKTTVKTLTGKPVIIPRTLVGRIIEEIL